MNISRFHRVAAADLAPVFEQLRDTSDPDVLAGIGALFENRAIGLLRTGSSSQLRDEAAVLNRFLYGRAGRELEVRDRDLMQRLRTISDLVARASERTDPMFVAAVLSSHKKYAQPILEYLWRAGEAVPRQQLLNELGIEESHLSHVLRDLEDADVIARIKFPGTKEVRIALAPVGRDLVKHQLIPPWFLSAVKYITDAINGLKPERADTVDTALSELQAPSRLIADHVNEVVRLASNQLGRTRSEARSATGPRAR